jgi:phenylalanine ammonia-lyase
MKKKIKLNKKKLCLNDIYNVSHFLAEVELFLPDSLQKKIEKSFHIVQKHVREKKLIYGVTTNFGGLAKKLISTEESQFKLQENLLNGLKCGTGHVLEDVLVRAGMLIRIQSLIQGASGVRYQILERFAIFLNQHVTPIVYHLGSIGASGDLVPLSYIAGSLVGLSDNYEVKYDGQKLSAKNALKKLQLQPLQLYPKEGLALVNGTSMCTGIAALSVCEFKRLFEMSIKIHALCFQALQGSLDALEEFVHLCKPHPGQISIAKKLRVLLKGSPFVKKVNNLLSDGSNNLVQDRYSLRCLPQFMGVIADGIDYIEQQVTIEANSVTDNPLINSEDEKLYQSGNFLAQYIGVSMDHMRHLIGLTAKHLDVQIAMLVSPEFNHGLPASLKVDDNSINLGLKGLQICANSIMPLLLHKANPLTTLFPTHAEQFNQNINSLGFGSAYFAWESVDLFKHYLSLCLIIAVQAIELRTFSQFEHYHAESYLSDDLRKIYNTTYQLLKQKPSKNGPLVSESNIMPFDKMQQLIKNDLDNPRSELLNENTT